MKPLPNINDAAEMIVRGQRSAIASARKEATEVLRDQLVAVQSAEWTALAEQARVARDAADRLVTLAAMWDELA